MVPHSHSMIRGTAKDDRQFGLKGSRTYLSGSTKK